MKYYIFSVFLLIIILSGCKKERYSGQLQIPDKLTTLFQFKLTTFTGVK